MHSDGLQVKLSQIFRFFGQKIGCFWHGPMVFGPKLIIFGHINTNYAFIVETYINNIILC